jgi:putative transposase
MVFFSRSSLERALTHYMAHYHEERNHQGLQNRLLKCSDGRVNPGGRVERRERLGGMLNFYYREAA